MKYVKYPSEYKEWVNKLVRQFRFRLEFNGKTLTTNDISSIKITSDLLPSDTFTIGSSVSETLEFDLFMDSDTFIDKSIPVKPYMSLYTEVLINNELVPVWQDVCLGLFYINSDGVTKKGLKTISVKASSMINNSEYGGRTYVAQEPFNGNVTTIINDVCSKMGITLKTTLPNITISNRDNINGMTYREVINYVALLYGGYARINNEGKLEFFKMTNTGYTYDTSNYISLSKDDELLTIKKFICALTEDSSLSAGTGTIAETVELACPDMTQSLLNGILNTYLNYGYHPITCKIFGNPILEPGDRISVVDVKGNTLELPIQSVTYNLSGSGLSMEIKSKYKVNSIAKGTSIRKAVSQLNQDIIKTNIIVSNEIEVVNANIENLRANSATIDDLKATNAKIDTLESTSVKTEELEAVNAEIEKLKSDKIEAGDLTAINAEIQNLKANKAEITDLNATNVNVSNLEANKANITDLNAATADINLLKTNVGNIQTLVNGNLTSDNIQSLILTSSKVTVENGFIKNAMIENISADKINTGTLNTSNVTIGARDAEGGQLLIADNTIQISDGTNVRIQIGKDASGDYNLYVWDSSGKLMWNASGITEDAIKSAIIRNDMVASDAAIDANKLNISSLFKVINEDGTNTINASQILLDADSQRLSTAFNSMTTKVDNNTSNINSLSTTLEVEQGKINTLISETNTLEETVTSQGTTINTLSDNYSTLNQTVDGISSTIATHTSQITTLNDSDTAIKKDVSSLQTSITQTNQEISLKASKTEVEEAISELETTTSSQISEIKQNVDNINLTIKSTVQEEVKKEVGNISLNVYTIFLSNEAQTISVDVNRLPLSSETFYTDIIVYEGTVQRNDYTIGDISSANGITVTKTESRVSFSVSNTTIIGADNGQFIIPIIIDEKTFNKTFSWSCAKQGNDGEKGKDAKALTINATSQIFKSVNGETYEPSRIILTAKLENIEFSKWLYSKDGSIFSDVVSGSNGLTASLNVLFIDNTSDLFDDNISSVIFKAVSTNSDYYDTITITKVFDLSEELKNVEGQVITNRDAIASLQLNTDSISASVKQVEENVIQTVDGIVTNINTLTEKVNATMTAEDVKLEIQRELLDGVDKVTTSTGFTFNEDGLKIDKSDSEMSTQITEDGMKIYKNTDVMLTANNQGVDAKNLHATTYLVIGGNSRFEDFVCNDSQRTACFWIGSVSAALSNSNDEEEGSDN